MTLAKSGQIAQAIEHFRLAVKIDPAQFASHANLGVLLAGQGLIAEAHESLEHALALKPDSDEVLNSLANVLLAMGQIDASVEHARRSLKIKPGNAQAFNALGNAMKEQGLLDEALDAFSTAAAIAPHLNQPASNFLYTLHFHPSQTRSTLLAAHRDWGGRHEFIRREFKNDRDPHRRLKIGYVSPDFREHPVGRFFLPIAQGHNQEPSEIYCYANVRASDAMTDQIRGQINQQADYWRDITTLTDAQACEMIATDGIDILVDLTMHMRSNRLAIFAAAPAPVQATYLAYCSTTGLAAIDYRLSDPHLDPPGTDGDYTERTIRLSQSYWCYQPAIEAPDVNDLPARSNGSITFGCLNNFCKVTSPTLAAWAKLLLEVPTSRLILHCPPGSHRSRVLSLLNVPESRITFIERLPMAAYFAVHHRIDIALDPFPYAGGTTTCDALWMGVPVVTLVGETAVARSGLSILTNVGCAQWVASNVDEYQQIALHLAGHLSELGSIRQSLRGRMRQSPLMDRSRFCRDLENAFRTMWNRWCG